MECTMSIQERETPWIQRIEDLIQVLEGSTVGELELTEAGTHIIIRRRPDMMMVSMPAQSVGTAAHPSGTLYIPASPAQPIKEDRAIPITTPLTGVYYSAPSPTSPPFVTPGSVIAVGQVIALVEAMKVFNEVQAEVAGRVTEMVAINGEVVQKGDTLLKVEPL
jgi:acetyl-CoA carboxylase biotin carboxyl carrier protein